MKSSLDTFYKLSNSKWSSLLFWIILIVLGVVILYIRYPFAYTAPNFYAEDGNVIFENIYNNGILQSLFTRFNGYFILLQYLLGYLAYLINNLIGGELYTLPKVVALVSYTFFAFACTLPWLLFRNRIGRTISLILYIFLLLTPLGRSDFAVLGTLGNLKFIIFYIAFILIIYRNDIKLVPDKSNKFYIIDFILLVCALTNILVVAILPLALIRYKDFIILCIKKREYKKIIYNNNLISILALALLLFVYTIWMYLLGIPKMPGYLDGQLILSGLINAIIRSSWYGLLYPVYTTLNILVSICLIILMFLTVFIKKNRVIYLSSIWAIFVVSVGFVLNRPGVTEFLQSYTQDGGPGQFFYGGTMIFMFSLMYLIHNNFNNTERKYKALILFIIFIYIAWALPYAGERSKSYAIYKDRMTSFQALKSACQTDNKVIMFNIYPTAGWDMDMRKEIACRGL